MSLVTSAATEKGKRAGSVMALPARIISTKNKHLLAIYAIPARGFTAAVSVFGGTPPPKPLICKIRFTLSGDAAGRSWAHHTGEDSLLVLVKFSLSPDDITWMSRFSCSQINRLLLLFVHTNQSAGKTKNPAYVSVSRVLESLFRFFTCLPPVRSSWYRACTRLMPGTDRG
jgi:hypothetical protein